MAGEVLRLANYIADVVKTAKTRGNAQQALIKGDFVVVGSKLVPYTACIDTLIRDGDWVWINMNDAQTRAVVVGK